MTADLLLTCATLVDGTGAPARRADVAVLDDRILAIGDLSAMQARETLDLGGLVLAPGFIDIHTHSDFSLLVDGGADSQIRQGVTTEVVGNCGHSCAPACSAARLSKHVFGYHPSVAITWTTFAGYLDRLTEARTAVNVAALVGHGALRLSAMEEPQRPSSDDERQRLRSLLEEALEAGAYGFTTGLEYAPGNAADPSEVVELCRVTARHGALYATHVRNRDYWYEMGLGEALATARQTGARLQVSHITPKYGAPPEAAEHMLDMVRWTRETGIDVAFDVIPHNYGPTTMSSLIPPWAFEGGIDRVLARLRDGEARDRIKANPEPMWKLVKDRRWDSIVLFHSEENPALVGMSFDEIGAERGVDPYDAALDLLAEEGDGMFGLTWLARQFSDADQNLLMRDPLCGIISDTITLSDSGPLARLRWSPSTWGWTARFIDDFARQRDLLPLVEAVRRLTSLAADRLAIKGRGRLEPGAFADLVVLDPDALRDRTSLAEPKRPPAGIVHVLVNGAFALRHGERTTTRSGRVLRRP